MHKIRKILKILFVILVCFTVFISSIYVFIAVKGKSIIENSLEKVFKKDVDVGSFRVSVPLNVSVSNVKIKDLGDIRYIYISPSLFGFLGAKIVINSIVVSKANLTFIRQKEEPPVLLPEQASVPKQKPKKINFRLSIPLIIGNLRVNNSSIELIDKEVSSDGLKLKIDSLDFSLKNFSLPVRPIKTIYKIKGVIPWENGHQAGSIEGDGWINFAKKDMEGGINLKDIDGVYLAPYYKNFIPLEELRIEKASLDFLTTLNSINNDLLIRSHLELKNLVFKKQAELKAGSKEQDTPKIMGAVFEMFTSLGGKIVLDFSVKTKFDKPRKSLENIKVTIEDKLSKREL